MALDWTQCAQWSAQTGFITHTRDLEWYSRNKKCGQNCCITFIGELTGTFSPQTPKFFPNLVWSDKFKCCDFYDSLCDAFFATFLACLAIYFITQDFLVTLLLEGYPQMSSLQNCKALAWITGGNHCIYGFNSISPVMINVEIVSIYHSKNHFQKERDRCHSSRHWVLLTIALRSSAYVEQVLSFLFENARNDLIFGPKAMACKNKLSSMPRTSRGDI